MAQCVVIADDLTGANATGVLFSKMNYKSFTLINPERLESDTLEACDCILIPTDSRALSSELAYNRVFDVCMTLKNEHTVMYSKRIDSTLRGNIGSETDAMLDALGEDYIAVVAPCFPSAKRVVMGGYMLVDKVLLHKTEIAMDPLNPITISRVDEIIKQQSKYKVATVLHQDLASGAKHLAECITGEVENGARIITLDCLTQEDLDLIADAIILYGKKIVSVDPGPFTATLASKMVKPASIYERAHLAKKRILMVVGSVNPVTRGQMEELFSSQQVYNVFVQTKEFLENQERREAEIKRISSEILENCQSYAICSITGDGMYPENRIDFEYYMEKYNASSQEVSKIMSSAVAEIAHIICLQNREFEGLYTSGGDITVAVCERFGASALDLQEEVVPLAAYSRIMKGELDGRHLITKGGSQGDKDAIKTCINFLINKINI